MIFLMIMSILILAMTFIAIATVVYVNSNIELGYEALSKKLIDINDMVEERFRKLDETTEAVKKDTKLNRVDLTAIRDKVKSKKAKKNENKV